MHPDLIQEIAEVIVRDQLILNWRFYALLCAIFLVASAVGNLLTSYFKKRGETYATKTDMQEILRQLHDSTRVTEEVRSAISHADWISREWRTTRRLKLEELLSSAYAIDKWLEIQKSKWLYGEEVAAEELPMQRLQIIATLYFPELQIEAAEVWIAHHDVYRLMLELGERTNAARNANDLDAHQFALSEFQKRHKPLYETAQQSISKLERKTSKLMNEIAGA